VYKFAIMTCPALPKKLVFGFKCLRVYDWIIIAVIIMFLEC